MGWKAHHTPVIICFRFHHWWTTHRFTSWTVIFVYTLYSNSAQFDTTGMIPCMAYVAFDLQLPLRRKWVFFILLIAYFGRQISTNTQICSFHDFFFYDKFILREDLSQKKQNFQSNFAEVNKADLIFRELRFWTIKNSQKFSSKTPIVKLKAVF